MHYEIDLSRPNVSGSNGQHNGRLRAYPDGPPQHFETLEEVRQQLELLYPHGALVVRVHDNGQEEIVSEL